MNCFENEQNQILEYFINGIENLWMQENVKDTIPFLEFFITPYCNQSCSYCYLVKHKNDLYPKDISNGEILNNLKVYLEYLYSKGIRKIYRLDLFSGEIWGNFLGNMVFDILLEYIDKGLVFKEIIIPSNCSFCSNKNYLEFVEYYIGEFRIRNIKIVFSVSIDGLKIDGFSRPLNNKKIKKDSEYYDKIYNFAVKYDYGFHPMIDANTIEYQIENYKTWIEVLKKYFPDDFKHNYGILMQLEVRESGWTHEKIIEYIKWLNFLYETDKKEYFNNDFKEMFTFYLEENTDKYKDYKFKKSYMPYWLLDDSRSTLGCSLGVSLCIRLGDLAIIPCHRTSYDKFIFGKYKMSEDKKTIIGVEANNIPLLNSIYKTGFSTKPYCESCPILHYCVQYCLGANYETNNELFYPIQQNCQLQFAKLTFICLKYLKDGIINFEEFNHLEEYRRVLSTINNLLEQEEIRQWIPYIQKII